MFCATDGVRCNELLLLSGWMGRPAFFPKQKGGGLAIDLTHTHTGTLASLNAAHQTCVSLALGGVLAHRPASSRVRGRPWDWEKVQDSPPPEGCFSWLAGKCCVVKWHPEAAGKLWGRGSQLAQWQSRVCWVRVWEAPGSHSCLSCSNEFRWLTLHCGNKCLLS